MAAEAAKSAEAAAAEAAAAVETVTDQATAAATEAATAAGDAVADVADMTAETFEAEQLKAALDNSNLSAPIRDALKQAVDAAASNPALAEATIARVREALGM